MLTQLLNLAFIGVCVGTISNTISRTKVFKEFRLAVYRKNRWLGEMVRCPYCLSHWLSFAAIAIFGPQYRITHNFLDYIVFSFTLVFIAACAGGLVRLSFKGMFPIDQDEIDEIDGVPAETQEEAID